MRLYSNYILCTTAYHTADICKDLGIKMDFSDHPKKEWSKRTEVSNVPSMVEKLNRPFLKSIITKAINWPGVTITFNADRAVFEFDPSKVNKRAFIRRTKALLNTWKLTEVFINLTQEITKDYVTYTDRKYKRDGKEYDVAKEITTETFLRLSSKLYE